MLQAMAAKMIILTSASLTWRIVILIFPFYDEEISKMQHFVIRSTEFICHYLQDVTSYISPHHKKEYETQIGCNRVLHEGQTSTH